MQRRILLLLVVFNYFVFAQGQEERYVPETNPLVLKKIKQWQNLKFGLLMHWGAYSQWGIVESWSLCPEEENWCERTKGKNPKNYFLYKKEYENLIKTFNPVHFNPQKWAKAAKNAGMKYVVFTTKHHDGFCMFDSKYTDYKITSANCPFSKNPKSNITKEIFNAFRKQGLWAGAYFSKPDWHVPSYWDPKYPPKDRNVNYNPDENPTLWNQYVEFTHNQILELLSDYGKVDILWLDGGWVAKKRTDSITSWYDKKLKFTKNAYLKNRIINQDIRMGQLVKNARKLQPDLIVVDRAVHGIHQNYLTPENHVPEKTLPYPWESCIISGGGWSYTPNAKYMSALEGIQLLVDVVAKGGNLLLNIAPSPDGTWQKGAYQLLKAYENWMRINSEAIYHTTPLKPYKIDNICMTKKNGDTFFYYFCKKGENTLPKSINIPVHTPPKNSKIKLLGYEKKLVWKKRKNKKGFVVKIPKELRKNPPCNYVWVLKVSKN